MQKWQKIVYHPVVTKVYRSVLDLADRLMVTKRKVARIAGDQHFNVINANTVLPQTVQSKSK